MREGLLTRAVSAWDYRQGDLSAFCAPFAVDEEKLAESLLSLRRKHAQYLPADRVEPGDIVTLRCRSEKPKFQKDAVTVNVGKGLYSRELEAQLPGLTAGEEKTLTAEGAEVTVQALKLQRTVLPELTDEFVAGHFESVHTLAELKDWFVRQQLEEHLETQAARAAESLKDQALAKSEFLVDEEERRLVRAEGEKIVRDMWDFNGQPLDQMTGEQARELLGHPSVQSYIDWFAGLSEKDLLCAALGWELLAAEGRAPTEESYQETLRKMREEEGISPEDLADYTLSAYVRQTCAEHYNSTLQDYAYQIIKEKLS